MHKDTLLFIHLDTHKVFTEVAHVDDKRGSMSQHYDKIQITKPAFIKRIAQFSSKNPGAIDKSSTKKVPKGIGYSADSPA